MTGVQETQHQEPLVRRDPNGAPVANRTSRRTFLGLAIGGGTVFAGALAAAAWFGLRGGDDDPGLLFVIPAGAGEAIGYSTLFSAIEMPTQIRFEKGETAAITVRNEDSMLLRAGPFLVGPGQTYTQRFPDPGEYPIACTADPAESIVVTVV